MNNSFNSLDEDIELQILQILQEREPRKISVSHGIREVWYKSSGMETELRIVTSFPYSLTISRVALVNKRKGTMSMILKDLIKTCERHHVPRLVVQCVLTEEMARFCLAKGFRLDQQTASVTDKDTFAGGDYILNPIKN